MVLDLQNNQLQNLPPGVFEGFGKLHTLNLSNNRINYVDPEIFRVLNKLQRLTLTGNPLTQENIDRLKQVLPRVGIIFK